jgi:hypothetical protein
MLPDEAGQGLSEPRRQAIFAALVRAQDEGLPVARSRTVIASQFGLTERQVRRIEDEGLKHEWPPLS